MAVVVEGLSFCYRDQKVLENVCLKASDGKVTSILGPNGAGKSTLLKCIAGILKPKEGTVLLGERDITRLHPMERARLIGYVPQSPPDGFPFSVFETVLLGRRPCMGWSPSKRDLETVSETLLLLGLERFSSRPVTELSGGERQKVLLAQALARKPKVLLLDEPTANLDLRGQLEALELIRGVVRERRIAAVLVLHDVNLATRFSDQIVFLHQGRVFAEGEPSSVLTTANVKAVYGVEAVSSAVLGHPFIVPIGIPV